MDRLDPDSDYAYHPLNQRMRGVSVKQRNCRDCRRQATEAMNGSHYCASCYRRQSSVLMGLMQQQLADERGGK